jgi:hypothetical protein
MGMDLVSYKREEEALSGRRSYEGVYFYWNMWNWPHVLKLAYDYGWKPRGTKYNDPQYDPKVEAKWNGSYCCNNFQVVTDEDAHNLACALQRAVAADAKPDKKAFPCKWETFRDTMPALDQGDNISDNKDGFRWLLLGFIDFCMDGAFQIA